MMMLMLMLMLMMLMLMLMLMPMILIHVHSSLFPPPLPILADDFFFGPWSFSLLLLELME